MKNAYKIFFFVILSLIVSCTIDNDDTAKSKQELTQINSPNEVAIIDTTKKEHFNISKQQYQNWRNIAEVLFYDGDSTSYAAYETLVNYFEQIKHDQLTISNEQLARNIENTFQGITSPSAKVKIDSILIASGHNTYFNP